MNNADMGDAEAARAAAEQVMGEIQDLIAQGLGAHLDDGSAARAELAEKAYDAMIAGLPMVDINPEYTVEVAVVVDGWSMASSVARPHALAPCLQRMVFRLALWSLSH